MSAVPQSKQRASRLSPVSRRRIANFRANKRGWWALWLFIALFGLTLFSELIANDRPLLVTYKGETFFPFLVDYPESRFGGFLPRTDYHAPAVADEIRAHGGMIWPLVRYSYRTIDRATPVAFPAPPSWAMEKDLRCARYAGGTASPECTIGNWHWLGTDDQGRDVLARVLYGFRLSVIFGLALAGLSSLVGITVGAVQGYLGGWTDLIGQRFIEIWTSIPSLYVLLIMSSLFQPSFFTLLGILLLFSWTSLVGLVRAEFLRGRNFEYVRAARALGVGDLAIMTRHILPNAMVATITFLPFILAGSVGTLTALDFLGLGLPVGSPSLGELLAQGKNNLKAPWLGVTGFLATSLILVLLIFIGEAVRDAFDPRKAEG